MVWQVRRASALVAACLAFALVAGCYEIRSSNGGGQASFDGARAVQVSDVAVPDGYRIEVVATGLTFPSAIVVDADGVPHVVEADYSYGEVWTVPRLLRIGSDGSAGAMAPALNDKPLPKALVRCRSASTWAPCRRSPNGS